MFGAFVLGLAWRRVVVNLVTMAMVVVVAL
jgi:hypothetical protein